MFAFALAILGAGTANATSVAIPAGGSSEACMSLTLADTLKYSFESDEPLQLDIYYRQGAMTFHPVLQRNRLELSGTLVPESASVYCASWQNTGDKEARLTYTLERVQGGR